MSEAKQSIVKLIKNKINCKSFRWSRSVGLDVQGTTLVITLASNKAGKNMQHLAACFEGWATILKTYVIDSMPDKYNQVELRCSDLMLPIEPSTANGHLMRFLYRVLRFKEQYDWFSVDASLQSTVALFENEILNKNKSKLVNNYPIKPSTPINYYNIQNNSLKEYDVECLLAEPPKGYTGKTLHSYFNNIKIATKDLIIDHQLPVGLFKNAISDTTRFFTGGKSAIDLWGFNQTEPNDFYVFELKYNNKMIGMISEIFFYANYMLDLLDKNGTFTLSDNGGKNFRHYSTIYSLKNVSINKMHAVILADKGYLHPSITKDLVAVLNHGNQKAIEYSIAEYEFDAQQGIITNIYPK